MTKHIAIPALAIEALAKRNYEAAMSSPWEGATAATCGDWIDEAPEQCEIVAPDIAAIAWVEGEVAGWKNATASKWGSGIVPNPYLGTEA